MTNSKTADKANKAYQKAIKKLEDLEEIINRSPAVYCIWHLSEGMPIEFISANISQFGYAKDYFQGQRIPAKSLIHPDDRARIEAETLQFLKEKPKEAKHEFRLLKKDGGSCWVEITVVPFFEEKGEPEYFQGVIFDIDERKKAQLALAESENIYRAIFANTGTAMAIADENRQPLLVNEEMQKLTGYSNEELTGKNISWLSFTAPHDVERLINYHRLRLSNPELAPRNYEYQMVAKNGEIKDVFMTSGLIPGTKKSLVSMMDISALKKVETALRKSEGMLNELFLKSLDIIGILDVRGTILYFSPSVKRVLNYEVKDLVGKNAFDFMHPDDVAMVINDFSKVITQEHKGIITVLRFRHADGSWVYLEALGNNCLDNPAIGGIIINARDITDRKLLEQQLLQSHKMEAVGTLAGGIAHNFNNILMGIQGYVSLMLLNGDKNSPDYGRLQNIQSLVQSAADLTAKILGFARGGKYEAAPTDLNALIARMSDIFGRAKKEITINQHYEKNLSTVEIDRVQIEQVIINIYVNAWQAMRDNGDIFVETANVSIDASDAVRLSLKPGAYVKASITDTGVGMDKQTCRRVFEPFFTTKEKENGLGMGLPSAYGIIREHGGAIEVISEPGHGSTFTFYLPASRKEAVHTTVPDKPVQPGRECILLVDDEEFVVEVCREILTSLGYEVMVATNGREALTIYENNMNKIDLIILDMIMPQMSGGKTFDKLREINPACKVMLSTGYAVSDQATRIMENGCSALIQKPFRIDELSRKIREVLDEKLIK